ncbi:MAG: membrane protein insertion efficiency factor YidD [Pseudomonadota bacterium]|jgi:putative membrane protein insertion efficiency factor
MPLLRHFPRYAIAGLIRMYQLTLSFWLGRSCRFTPSCSAYAREAILRFGVIRGGYLGANRVLRCGPFSWFKHQKCTHGFDPVPDSWHGWRHH